MRFSPGKLPPEILRDFFAALPRSDPSLIAGPGIGVDVSVIDNGGPDLLVAKTDPITFAADKPGHYLLAVNGNDLATVGADPRWLLTTVLLPKGSEEGTVRGLLAELRDACEHHGVDLAGGHTEVTIGIDRPILVGMLLGTVPRDRLIHAPAQPGDAILLAGGIAIEGTAILATEHASELRERGVASEVIAEAAGWLDDPGISVVPAAHILREAPGVRCMHDPTEGGLATALREMAECSGVGLRVDHNQIDVLPACKTICEALELNPVGLLASGALLAAVCPEFAGEAIGRLRSSGTSVSVLGTALSPDEGLPLPFPEFARDELARYLDRE